LLIGACSWRRTDIRFAGTDSLLIFQSLRAIPGRSAHLAERQDPGTRDAGSGSGYIFG
jgi:hypothetical protein